MEYYIKNDLCWMEIRFMKYRKRLFDSFVVWLTGAVMYFFMEILIRGYSHISMFICGGMAFFVIDKLWWSIRKMNYSIMLKVIMVMMIGSCVITALEYITGVIVNIKFGLDVWDYSELRFNYRGQICMIYSILWSVLSAGCIVVSEILRKNIIEDKKSLNA